MMVGPADTFPTSEHLNEALERNPFTAMIEKYHGRYDGSPKIIEEIYEDLLANSRLAQLREDLAEQQPTYTTVYRYDPFSITSSGDRGGCFGYDQSYGASTASLRIFEQLQGDSIVVLRTEEEAMAVIAQPATLLTQGRVVAQADTPTVLFTSKQFEKFGSRIDPREEREFGLVITSGDSLTKAAPPARLMSSSMQVEYYGQRRPRG